MQTVANTQLLKTLIKVFPRLERHSTKGQNGRMAVIGGSFEFTGAPYYSAISALKVGGDLSHIFCSKFSSPAIKSYSPQIITHPLFISQQELTCTEQEQRQMLDAWAKKLKDWRKAIHCWVIGPGLGRDKYMQEFFPKMVKVLPDDCMVTFDADGIYYLCQYPELFEHLKRFRTIVSPNLRELAFLQKHFKIPREELLSQYDHSQGVMEFKGNWSHLPFSMIIKGVQDVIITKDKAFVVGLEGGNKRCGGIGDIVAGVGSVCAYWDQEYGLPLACCIVKEATRLAFEREGRGVTAPNVIEYLSTAVKHLQALQ